MTSVLTTVAFNDTIADYSYESISAHPPRYTAPRHTCFLVF